MSNVVRGALNTHIIYIDLASATAMKMASRSIALISQKTNFHLQPTLFFSNQQKKKKKFASAARFFAFFATVLQDYNAVLCD